MSTNNVKRVRDVLLPLDRMPIVGEQSLLREALEAMTKYKLGIVCAVDADGRLKGVFTDGDIRRMILRIQKPFSYLFADDIMSHASAHPTTVDSEATLVEAVLVMEQKSIWDLPVIDKDGKLMGLLHLHPTIKTVLGL